MRTLTVLDRNREAQASGISLPLPPYGRVGLLSIVLVRTVPKEIAQLFQFLIALPLTKRVEINHGLAWRFKALQPVFIHPGVGLCTVPYLI